MSKQDQRRDFGIDATVDLLKMLVGPLSRLSFPRILIRLEHPSLCCMNRTISSNYCGEILKLPKQCKRSMTIARNSLWLRIFKGSEVGGTLLPVMSYLLGACFLQLPLPRGHSGLLDISFWSAQQGLVQCITLATLNPSFFCFVTIGMDSIGWQLLSSQFWVQRRTMSTC